MAGRQEVTTIRLARSPDDGPFRPHGQDFLAAKSYFCLRFLSSALCALLLLLFNPGYREIFARLFFTL